MLRILNAYACRGRHGWSLVDCGMNTPATQATWQRVFAELGFGPRDVEAILVTHLHPDHYGAAGWLQELTGAPVYMHDREIPTAERMWGAQRYQAEETAGGFCRHGLPPELAAEMINFALSAPVHPRPVDPVPLREGETVRLGDRDWRVLWTPGHSDGLAVFWCEPDRVLLVNDMVLNEISPNIQLLPNFHPDPLAEFLNSLAQVARLPARLSLPGHRSLIHHLGDRCRQLIQHHQDRLHTIREMARHGATAWAVCRGLFAPRLTDIANIRFAMAETMSHLMYLTHRASLTREETPAGYLFRAP